MSGEKTELDECREKINAIDDELLKLIIKRADEVKKVGKFKEDNHLPIRNLERKLSQMKRFIAKCIEVGRPELVLYVTFVFRGIIEASVILQGDHRQPTGDLFCVFHGWRSRGYSDPAFDWPVCPTCRLPLFPK